MSLYFFLSDSVAVQLNKTSLSPVNIEFKAQSYLQVKWIIKLEHKVDDR